jgi:hypothetical protein
MSLRRNDYVQYDGIAPVFIINDSYIIMLCTVRLAAFTSLVPYGRIYNP